MDKCEKHFNEDLTAHATAVWFLSELSEKSVKGFIDSFSEDDSPLSEELCKGLNVVHFIDCLRHRIHEDKEKKLLDILEHIAKELENTGKWENFPYLCVLLLSMARKSLKDKYQCNKESLRNTSSLYKVVEKTYNFKKKDDVSLALEAGIQLSHFQKSLWQQEFTNFKIQHYKTLSKLRQQYYLSIDDNSTFARRVRERYEWNNPTRQNQKGLTDFEKELEFYKKNILNLDFLNPLCLKLPIRNGSYPAMDLANKFTERLQAGSPDTQFSKKMANQFRILQWDIFGRDLVQEYNSPESKLSFYSITEEKNIETMLNDDDLIEFIHRTRSVEWSFSPSEEEMPKDLRDNSNLASNISKNDDKIRAYLTSFRDLLPKVAKKQESAHHDFVRSFANSGRKSILIKDGEFSFFSLLWLLRRAATQKHVKINEWLLGKGEAKESEVRFCPSDNIDKCSSYEFAEECGFIIRLFKSDECVSTTRWQSLITWLRRLNRKLREIEEYKKCFELCQETEKITNDNDLLKLLPVKTLDYNEEETSFVKGLWKFFTSESLEGALNKINETSPDAPMTCADFVTGKLEPLVTSFRYYEEEYCEDDVLLSEPAEGQIESQGDLNDEFQGIVRDTVLLRCCQAVFLPLEYLFRACAPYETHLLIQALNWEESSVSNLGTAPTSLGFATIVGRIENADPEDFERWRVPYRSLFSTLSAGIALPAAQEDSKQIGKRTQQRYFAHQTIGLLDTIWQDPNRNRLDFHSGFALWLARIQATEVWGGAPIDPREPIPDVFPNSDIFPKWESLDEKQTVQKLVDLGLWGGIMRATKPRKEGGITPEDYRLSTHSVLLRARGPENAISQTRNNILSFESTKNIDFPQWVKTKAFAMLFYHGLRQAAYHALETFVLIDEEEKQQGKPCLLIGWNDQSVAIYNRGKVDPENHYDRDFKTDDRMFFDIVVDKINKFCHQFNIAEKFEIDGPKPVYPSEIDGPKPVDPSEGWQFVIKKEE